MKLLRDNKNWLRHRVNLLLKENHKELFQSSWKSNITRAKEYSFDSNRWWLILIIVIAVFIVGGLINIDILNFLDLTKSTAMLLVDERAGNIASITAITLVVVGFLINNLAVKKEFAFRLLFKHSYLYPIIYFTLSTIGCFFIVSTLRDELESTRFINMVLAGIYLSLVIIILIGFLFNTIIQFTNDKVISKLLHDEFMAETTRNLKSSLLNEYSSKLYKDEMEKHRAIKYNSLTSIFLLVRYFLEGEYEEPTKQEVEEMNCKKRLVYDINLKSLNKFISKKRKQTGEIYFQDLALENVITEYDNYLWREDVSNTKSEKAFLRKNIILRKPKNIKQDKESVRKYYDLKLEELAKNSEYTNLEYLLTSYLSFQELQMKNQLGLYVDDTYTISEMQFNIRKAIGNSIENNSKETFYVLSSFVRKVLQLCIKNKSIQYFEIYIFFPSSFYSIAYEKKLQDSSLEQLYKKCSENVVLHLKEIINSDIRSRADATKNIEEKKGINRFFYSAFDGYSYLLYLMVKNRDINQFKYALNEYEQISGIFNVINSKSKSKIKELQKENRDGKNNEKIKALKEKCSVINKFETYYRHVLLGIKYWVLFLYQTKKLDEELTFEFFKLMRVDYSNSEDMLNDILFFRSGQSDLWYMGWRNWDVTERQQSNKAYPRTRPHDWLTLGFMVDLIRENHLYTYRLFINPEERNVEESSHVKYTYDSLKDLANYFKENFDKWKNILKAKSIENLEEKIKQILPPFAALKRKKDHHVEKEIASAPLSQNKIDIYKNSIGEAWRSQARINLLFKKLGATEHITNDKIKLKNIEQRKLSGKAKMMFIEGEHYQEIYGIDRTGVEIGRGEDSEFFSTIIKSDHNKVSGSSLLEVLNKAIAELKIKDITPNLILIAERYNCIEIFESKLFVPNINDPNLCLETFNGIPVYLFYNDFLKNRALVCNFRSAFKMRYKTNPDWFENELAIDVREVSDEEAKIILEEQPDAWKKTEYGIELSDEDALTLIKTSVIIDCWSTLDFQVMNTESFIMGYIKQT